MVGKILYVLLAFRIATSHDLEDDSVWMLQTRSGMLPKENIVQSVAMANEEVVAKAGAQESTDTVTVEADDRDGSSLEEVTFCQCNGDGGEQFDVLVHGFGIRQNRLTSTFVRDAFTNSCLFAYQDRRIEFCEELFLEEFKLSEIDEDDEFQPARHCREVCQLMSFHMYHKEIFVDERGADMADLMQVGEHAQKEESDLALDNTVGCKTPCNRAAGCLLLLQDGSARCHTGYYYQVVDFVQNLVDNMAASSRGDSQQGYSQNMPVSSRGSSSSSGKAKAGTKRKAKAVINMKAKAARIRDSTR